MFSSKSKQKVWVYSQDVGGAKFIAPVIRAMADHGGLKTVIHPLSEPVFRLFGIPYEAIADYCGAVPVMPEKIEKFLEGQQVTHVIATTSAKRDLTNGRVIQTANRMGIPTLAFLDHWKGLDRFANDKKEAVFMPQVLGCIDEFSKQAVSAEYPAASISVVGHPYLESLIRESPLREKPRRKLRVLLVSQPDPRDGSFESIFLKKYPSGRLIDRLLETFAGRRETLVSLAFRPHPKDGSKKEDLPAGIQWDPDSKWEDNTLQEYDVFVGYDSMLLVEASVNGKICVTLDVVEWSGLSDLGMPYRCSIRTQSLDDFLQFMERKQEPSGLYPIIHGSCERALDLMERFIQGELCPSLR